MERHWSGNQRRLRQADLSEIERLTWGGETFEAAAAAVGCSTKSIQRFLALTGGVKRRVKERSALRLSLADREELSRGLVAGESLRTIARRLKRAPSTISRASSSVETANTVRPSGTLPATSSQFSSGARNQSAPASSAP